MCCEGGFWWEKSWRFGFSFFSSREFSDTKGGRTRVRTFFRGRKAEAEPNIDFVCVFRSESRHHRSLSFLVGENKFSVIFLFFCATLPSVPQRDFSSCWPFLCYTQYETTSRAIKKYYRAVVSGWGWKSVRVRLERQTSKCLWVVEAASFRLFSLLIVIHL